MHTYNSIFILSETLNESKLDFNSLRIVYIFFPLVNKN